jgi:hypothetical protein
MSCILEIILTVKGEHTCTIRMCENRVLRGIFGLDTNEIIGS